MFCCLCFVRKLQNRLHVLRTAVKEIVIHKYPYDWIRLIAIKDTRILILLVTLSKFNIRMRLTDARESLAEIIHICIAILLLLL